VELLPIPPWEGAHPIVVHFPIGLLLFAPLLVVLALLVPKLRRGLAVAALATMAAGATGAVVAVASGEATAEVVGDAAAARGAERLLHDHGEAGERARNAFLVLTGLYGLLGIVPAARGKELSRKVDLAAHGAFLLAYAGGCLLLAHAGHLGGRLVHEKGVRAHVGLEAGSGGGGAEDRGGGRRRGGGGR
jgi:uncharacterized membrane protein